MSKGFWASAEIVPKPEFEENASEALSIVLLYVLEAAPVKT
jgi:hypothetical protein